MKKNFKYILIFIFIVCLLIPISCINIFAASLFNSYVSNYSTAGLQIDYYNINSFEYNNNTYTCNKLTLRIELNNSGYRNVNYKLDNSNTYNNLYYNSTNNTITLSIYINCNNDSYFYLTKINNDTNSSSSNTFNYNVNYLTKNYDYEYYTFQTKSNSGNGGILNIRTYITYSPTTISFDKSYNLSFYNNDILYDSITISGASTSGYAPFDEISQIKYGNTIVYDNSVWSSGYNSTLRYNQLMTQPDVTNINSDCNSIITFTTQYYVDTISFFKTYNVGTFYNDTGQSNEYSSITIIGKVANGTITPFLEISQIKYDSTLVYDNNTWVTGYSNYLYTNVGTTLSLNSINTDCNNIIIFVNYYIDARIYDIGTFFIGDNSNVIYSSIQVKGSPNSNNTFSSIDIISYDSTIVYQNGSWVSGYSPNLKYFAYNDIDINQLNVDCNNIIVFTKTQAESINPQLHNDLLGGVNVILFPITSLIEQANNNIVIALVLMFLVVNFVVSIVFIFIKVKNK